MTAEVSSVLCGGPGFAWPPDIANGILYRPIDNRANLMTPCEAYQKALDQCESDVLVMVHDDVTIHGPNWLNRILALFKNPECVAVGFGGATALGRPDLYRKQFDIWNMARGGYASNQADAEVHGERFTGDRQVAVLDAFCMAVRADWLRGRDGWPVDHISHHCLDLWLACEAARCGKEIWMCGVDCTHHGGGTSVTKKYSEASWLQGGSLAADHQAPHVFLWDSYRDVLPVVVR